MSLASISIKRPTFIICVIVAVMIAGAFAFSQMSVDMYPETSIPVITVQTTYAGAGPAEIETLISRPIEDEISSLAGIKKLTSRNLEGVSVVVIEFQSSIDSKYAEQQVRDKISTAKSKLPSQADDPVIKKFDLSDSPILMVSLAAEGLSDAQMFDLADQYIKPRFEQVNNVGAIDIVGGRKREIHVLLDQAKLHDREISVGQVATQIGASGENIPTGKVTRDGKEVVYRGLGEFRSVSDIQETLVNLFGNEVPTRVSDLGKVVDSYEDEKSRGFYEGKRVVILQVYRQAGSNTVKVASDVKKQIEKMKSDLLTQPGKPEMRVMVDSSTAISDNVSDVYETIIIGIILTIVTVFFFLGSVRSTLITALSLPVSLIGSFVLLWIAGFTINVISLLALTLAVGLLIDDAIVVIENIYRRMELGENSEVAAEKGTAEIQLAVFAITLVVMAVFVPVGMMSGTIGQFFKQFGLTVAFSMGISLFVALTIIPMLAAHFGGEGHGSKPHGEKKYSIWDQTMGRLVRGFDKFQTWLEQIYALALRATLRFSKTTLLATLAIFITSLFVATKIPSEFVPDADDGQSAVTIELNPGASLDATTLMSQKIGMIVKEKPDVDFVLSTIGGSFGEANKAQLFVKLKEFRKLTTSQFRDALRKDLEPFAKEANPIVKKYDSSGGGAQPFVLNLVSLNAEALEKTSNKIVALLKNNSNLKDVDTNFRIGKEEVQIHLKPGAAKQYGINTKTMGSELRAQVAGLTTAKFREGGREYDVRVRLQDSQRDLKQTFKKAYVPNVNRKLVLLNDIADADVVSGPASIERMDRSRYIQITANLAQGADLNKTVKSIKEALADGPNKLPQDVRYSLGGDTESMNDMAVSAMIAVIAGIICIYLILSSLYESFITPITIMISFPLALSGAFYGLYFSGKSLNMFAILGLFMLIGVAGKNGILLVDFAKQKMDEGMGRVDALVAAGTTRLRPILMTTFALVAGTLPIAVGLNPASKTRTSMGVVIIAGVLIATLLTLLALPSLFLFVDRFRVWANNLGTRFTSKKN